MASSNQSVARDVFMYLLVIVVLAMSAVSFGALVFDLINHYLPDVANNICGYDGCVSSIRSELAFLIVAFPVLIWAWRFLRRDIAAHPEKEDLKIRKWLLYLALFVAGVTVIGDLIAVIRSWLEGELTLQFSLKVLTVFYIAASVFYYFLRQLHPEERGGREGLVAKVAIGAVAVAVIAGFWTAGSPASARDRNLDMQRVNDLSLIQYQIVGVFWTAKARLPESLDELQDPVSGFLVPADPESGQPYEYSRTGTRQFVLCATFSTESTDQSATAPRLLYPGEGNWDHGIGRTCFTRTVDPELYPPKVQ